MNSLKFPAFEPIDLKNASTFSMVEIPINNIIADPNQPRRKFEDAALDELACSVREHGVIQPIIVKQLSDSEYQLITGERRWRAAKIAELKFIPAIIKKYEEKDNIAIALIENIQREELNPIELAESFYRLQEEHNLSHTEIAKLVGKQRTTVSNMMRLLGLTQSVKELVINGQLEMGHARAILSLEDSDQIKVAAKIVENEMSVRKTEAFVRSIQATNEKRNLVVEKNPKLSQLEQELYDLLGITAKIQLNAKGRGRLTCRFPCISTIEKLIEHLHSSKYLEKV